jgi:hypothetical protein
LAKSWWGFEANIHPQVGESHSRSILPKSFFMSRRKKKRQNASPQTSTQVPSSNVPLPTPEAFSRQITFDSLEDRIRGEDVLQEQEQKKDREERDIKKQLDSAEVDRRMEELRRQLGLQNDIKKRKKS